LIHESAAKRKAAEVDPHAGVEGLHGVEDRLDPGLLDLLREALLEARAVQPDDVREALGLVRAPRVGHPRVGEDRGLTSPLPKVSRSAWPAVVPGVRVVAVVGRDRKQVRALGQGHELLALLR
jgi:hypothetical protein